MCLLNTIEGCMRMDGKRGERRPTNTSGRSKWFPDDHGDLKCKVICLNRDRKLPRSCARASEMTMHSNFTLRSFDCGPRPSRSRKKGRCSSDRSIHKVGFTRQVEVLNQARRNLIVHKAQSRELIAFPWTGI